MLLHLLLAAAAPTSTEGTVADRLDSSGGTMGVAAMRLEPWIAHGNRRRTAADSG